MAVNTSAALNVLKNVATAQDAASGQLLILAYEQIIGRPPTTAELALGLQQLQNGTPTSTLRAIWPRRDMAPRPWAKFIRT